jgi:hypothetical protein
LQKSRLPLKEEALVKLKEEYEKEGKLNLKDRNLKSAKNRRQTRGSKVSQKRKKTIRNPKKFEPIQPKGVKNKSQRQKS